MAEVPFFIRENVFIAACASHFARLDERSPLLTQTAMRRAVATLGGGAPGPGPAAGAGIAAAAHTRATAVHARHQSPNAAPGCGPGSCHCVGEAGHRADPGPRSSRRHVGRPGLGYSGWPGRSRTIRPFRSRASSRACPQCTQVPVRPVVSSLVTAIRFASSCERCSSLHPVAALSDRSGSAAGGSSVRISTRRPAHHLRPACGDTSPGTHCAPSDASAHLVLQSAWREVANESSSTRPGVRESRESPRGELR